MRATLLRKSKYCFLVKDKEVCLAYSSARNGFHVISEYVYDVISNASVPIDDVKSLSNAQEIETLHTLGLLSTEKEDDMIVDNLRLRYLKNSFSSANLHLTILPTLGCNLRCPYCFEKNKPTELMSREVCDNLIKFIKGQKEARKINITWFGGEPLMGASVIQYLLAEIDRLEDQELGGQGMVTNAVLLRDQVLDVFKEHPLDFVQVTIDGKKEIHDTKRVRHDGTGTYDVILENLDNFIARYPDTRVSIRVNVDKNNVDDFMDLYDDFHARYANKENLSVYPGILKSCGKAQPGSPFILNEDMMAIRERFARRGYPLEMPFTNCSGCTASCLSAFVIGPKGEIYKCWEDVGCEDRVVGHIDGTPAKTSCLLTDYLLHGSHILDEECEDCPLLPVCSSDCPHDRLAAREGNFDKQELCPYIKIKDYEGLGKMLLHIYREYKENQLKKA